ncbi:hypothetical protein [Cellulomonas sp. Marseille-Q8402]
MTDRTDITRRPTRPSGRAARRQALAEEDARDEALWRLELSRFEPRTGGHDDARRAREREQEFIRLSLESARYWHEEHKRLTRGGLVQQMWRSLFT